MWAAPLKKMQILSNFDFFSLSLSFMKSKSQLYDMHVYILKVNSSGSDMSD